MELKPLLLKIYEAASMQRWNDQIRTIDITELDKQAHKMIVAYALAKIEQSHGNSELDWIQIIQAGLFEYLQRIVLTDLKPPLFYQIKKDRKKYCQLNQWVYSRIYPSIKSMGDRFCEMFKNYILSDDKASESINRKIVGAAHFYVTKWEFDIIHRLKPGGYQVEEIRSNIEKEQQNFSTLACMQELLTSEELLAFIDICGQLRFQVRWSHIYRVPRTSVLGHMLIVAVFSYLFSYLNNSTSEVKINNYFTGLFHDLPEVLTRDIINPVKKSVEGLDELIKEYEKKEMDEKIYKLLPASWHESIKLYTETEFENTDKRDGALVKAADDLAAFIEAYLCVKNGISNESLKEAMDNLMTKYDSRIISGIDLGTIYGEF